MSDDNNSDSLDIGGKKNRIELLPENLSVGRELMPADAVSQIGEKMGINDQHVKDMFPKIKDFKGSIHFESIKNKENKTIGVFIIGTKNREELFRYKVLYINGKYVKTENPVEL
jgi:hypothetical protein